jgi:serine protease Do
VVEAVHRRSPAESVGVRAGDQITQVGDVAVTHQFDIERALLGRKPGERVPVTVVRAGAEERVEMSLAVMQRDAVPLEQRCWQEVGLRLEAVPAVNVQKLQSRYRGGLVVTEVREGGPAAEQGIRVGDILVGLHVWETIAIDNIAYILDRAEADHLNPIKFYVLRGRETLFGHLVSETVRR